MAQVQVQPQAPVSAPNGVASDGVNQFVSTSLYVGDLDHNVAETQLYDLFNQLGQVVSIRICRDLTTRRSLGYGYVNYSNIHDAARALEVLNFMPLNGKPIRIMYSHRDPTIRKSGTGNIYIKNLDKAIDNKALHDTFSTFGTILSCKVATDSSGQSLGYGFVQFDNEESAKNAIEKLNGMLLNDKQVYVGPFLRKQERESAIDKTKFNNVYVKNMLETTTKEELKKIFGEYGTITSAVVMRDGDGKSKCFGFVNFENSDDAVQAVEALNGKKIDEKEWYVGKAQKRSERESELKGRFEQTFKETVDKFKGLNLYIKNLDDSITDDKLKELFSEFGTITSCKVMRDPNGTSRGSGFVAFSTAEEASRALSEMNGKMVVSKPLYVAHAQRKEERRARLQAQFSQMRLAMAPALGPRIPIYSPGTPGIGQQLFYGQAPPAMVSPQAGFGYQQQLVPGMRPNFFVPMVQPGQQTQRPGGRRAGAGPMQPQQPLPMMQPQMHPRGRSYRYPPVRNIPDVPMAGLPGGMLPVSYNMGGMPIRDAAFSQPMQAGALATALANATPEQQRMLLGENLYPLVDQLEHENAAKVTGMLLEMDQTEVLHLLESPEALKSKVAEAMEVLKTVQQQQQAAAEAEPATMSMVRRAIPDAPSLEEANRVMRGNWLQAIEQHHLQYSGKSMISEILESGCSVGVSTRFLADKFPLAKVTGKRTPRKNPIRWIHANGEDTGLPSKSYDLVSVAAVLHECPERAIVGLLREAFRLLRPGGTIALTDQAPKSKILQELSPVLFTLFKSTEPLLDEYYMTDLEGRLKEVGFVNVQSVLTDPRHKTVTATVPKSC